MMNKAPPFKGFNIRITILTPIKDGGLLVRGLHYLDRSVSKQG